MAGVLGDAAAGIFDGAAAHTPVEVTETAVARAKEVAADSVVSVGGGSTTGLGKALAARTGLPHLVLPTTYAGSEVTSLLGETADGEKVTRTGPEILPEVVVYDVALTTTLPWPVTVTSAVNAMAHAVEALYAPDRTAETDRMAVESLDALARGLRSLQRDPDDLDARDDLLYGAWLAGRCLAAVGMGLHHKLCHTLGGSFGLPHAATHTVVLPHAMAYNARAAPEAMTAAAAALGVDEAPSGLQALVVLLGGPIRLHDLGFDLADVPRAAALATARPYPNPRPVDHDGIVALLTHATEGTTIGGAAPSTSSSQPAPPPDRGEPMTTPDPSVPTPGRARSPAAPAPPGPPDSRRDASRVHGPRAPSHGPDQQRRRAHRAVLPGRARVPTDRASSRTATTPAPRTSSSTSATTTCWPSSTSPGSTSGPTPRCWAACTTSPSPWSPSTGTPWSHG